MKKKMYIILLCSGLLFNLPICAQYIDCQRFHGIEFTQTPTVWDEGIPLGNGIMGTLIWEKENKLRLALDRADLWDLRPVKEFDSPDYSYQFICNEIIRQKDVSKILEENKSTNFDVALKKHSQWWDNYWSQCEIHLPDDPVLENQWYLEMYKFGYTYTWLANMKARVFDGDAASRALHIFIKAFCSPNSFHLNGDQLQKGYSSLTYRPFTLEGNFACASAIQEMLLQSHTGVIQVFPALPENWESASFHNMRAMGAFLVSADYKNGKVQKLNIHSEKGGLMKVLNPFTNQIEEKLMQPGECIEISQYKS